jgi:integrase
MKKRSVRIGKTIRDVLNFYDKDIDTRGIAAIDTTIGNMRNLERKMGNKRVRDFSRSDIRKYIAKRRKEGTADNTIIRELGVLATALNYCVEEEILAPYEINIVEKMSFKKPKLQRRIYVPLNSEFEAIMKHLPKYLVTFCHGLKFTAYRRGELERLQFMDIDFISKFPEIRLNRTKTDQPRNSVMYSELYEHMKNQLEDAREAFGRKNVNDVYVYREADGKTPIIRKNTYTPWRKANIKAGCTIVKNGKITWKFVFHDLRRFGVKFLSFEKKFNRNIIMKYYTGHTDVETFEKNYNIQDADTDLADRMIMKAA